MNDHEVSAMCIDRGRSIRTALQSLCANGRQTLFIVDHGVLCGSVSDGDIRRFLLDGGSIDAPAETAANGSPKFLYSSERRNAETFLWENQISAVPIVDENLKVVDVVSLHESVDIEGVSIRQLVPRDLDMVLEFFDQMAGDTRAMFNRGDVNRLRVIEHLQKSDLDRQIHFAAVIRDGNGGEQMVGYVFLWDIHKTMPWLGIAVREDWKGHHLGRKLLEFLDDWARPKGYGGLMLTSVPANIRAHALYTRMGFEYFGVFPDSEFLYIKRYEI